ncbi:MAG: HAD-IIIA family hydrolase [Polyangiaceae bacterium]|nr:HAD-IIIA family hydrolase [Polyangiaceae bacterium]
MILDRDGTIIDFHRDTELGVVTPAFHPRLLRFLPGALDALQWLHRHGALLTIASNQPGAAKGEISRDAIERTTEALVQRLAGEGIPISAVEVCLHHPTGGDGGDPSLVVDCTCRKPKPGMLIAIADKLGKDPRHAWMVGDTPTDVQAGRAAGMKTALLSPTRRCELCPMRDLAPPSPAPDIHAPTLLEIAHRIVAPR